jgi:hypothetical protein
MTLFFITGYTKHGKDTFYKSLNTHNYDFVPPALNNRIAFADFLKEEVSALLNLTTYETVDKDKVIQEGLTFRDYCIQISYQNKLNNKYYYCQKVHEKVLSYLQQGQNVFITDWRFKEEYEYFTTHNDFSSYKIITLRIFRPDYPIPDINIPSEHSLDDVNIDFTIINQGEFIVNVSTEK